MVTAMNPSSRSPKGRHESAANWKLGLVFGVVSTSPCWVALLAWAVAWAVAK